MIKHICTGILVLIAFVSLVSCNPKKEKEEVPATSTEKEQPRQSTDDENIYLSMRTMAFGMQAEQIGLTGLTDDEVYGQITEIDMGKGTVSVISYLSGDTSLYLSSGGAFIGAGQHQDVKEMVAKKVASFQKYVSKAKKVDAPFLPAAGKVNFNFLTKNGVYVVTVNLADLESGKSEYADLFGEVNEIITQIRLKSSN